jgi:hypothetical protein
MDGDAEAPDGGGPDIAPVGLACSPGDVTHPPRSARAAPIATHTPLNVPVMDSS